MMVSASLLSSAKTNPFANPVPESICASGCEDKVDIRTFNANNFMVSPLLIVGWSRFLFYRYRRNLLLLSRVRPVSMTGYAGEPVLRPPLSGCDRP